LGGGVSCRGEGVSFGGNMEKIFNRKKQKDIRQELRKTISIVEKTLWQKIRNQQLGVKFRRQHGIGRYVADFYAPDIHLVIELDGDSHYQDDAQEYDRIRDEFMRSMGLRILRFTNDEVMNNLDEVVLKIFQRIKQTAKQTPP
jgi:very-short-patch-repair endonuclease